MGVMSAGMHLTGHFRPEAIGDLRLGFRQWQGVHVGAQEDGATCPRSVENAHDAGLADPGSGLDAELAESVGDNARRPVFLERDLGMAVNVPAVGDGADTDRVGFIGDVERVHQK